MFLLDTDVISRTSPMSVRPAEVLAWLSRHERDSFLSVLTVSELTRGITALRLRGATRKAAALAEWLAEVEESVSGRLLDVDRDVAMLAGELLAAADAVGQQPGFVDACLAATAKVHGLSVVTFNARHFDVFGVPHRRPSTAASAP